MDSMLAKHGKAPTAKMRINASTEFYETCCATCEAPDDRAITDFLIAVARRLQKIERERVRSAL